MQHASIPPGTAHRLRVYQTRSNTTTTGQARGKAGGTSRQDELAANDVQMASAHASIASGRSNAGMDVDDAPADVHPVKTKRKTRPSPDVSPDPAKAGGSLGLRFLALQANVFARQSEITSLLWQEAAAQAKADAHKAQRELEEWELQGMQTLLEVQREQVLQSLQRGNKRARE